MVLLMWHSEPSNRGRACPAHERNPQPSAADNFVFRSFSPAYASIWPLPPPGLPLFTTSPAERFSGSGARTQSGVHGETTLPTHGPGASNRASGRLFNQLVGGTSIAAGAQAAQRPWLSAGAKFNTAANSITCRTVTFSRSYPKFTGCWCHRRNATILKPALHP